MPEQTIPAPTLRRPALARKDRERRGVLELARRYPWPIGAIGLLGLSLLIVLWARTRPGYDPYGWLIWGHQTLHWSLNTDGAPSWKPLPFLFTVPYSLAGHYALWLWMVTCVAMSLSGAIFAGRIAYTLTGARDRQRWIGYLAAVLAGAFVLGIHNYTHYYLSSQSDPMIVALCLAAIDCHLHQRYRWAFAAAVLAALGRPEVWPFIGIYAIWAWRSVPEMRRVIVFGLLVLPLLWFGIPALTSKSWFSAGTLALKSPRALHENKVTGTIDRFFDLQYLPVWLAALVGVAWAALRRNWTLLVLAGGSVAWVLIEIAFVLHGWPGVPRYLFEPVAVSCVIAAVAAGWILLEVPALLARQVPRLPARAASLAAIALVAVLVGTLVSPARQAIATERVDLKHERARTKWINHLPGLISRLGGTSRLWACGKPSAPVAYQSILAWNIGSNTGPIYWTQRWGRLHPGPVVYFKPTPHAWVIETLMEPAAKQAQCKSLNHVSWVT
jgi:hypothetical protein